MAELTEDLSAHPFLRSNTESLLLRRGLPCLLSRPFHSPSPRWAVSFLAASHGFYWAAKYSQSTGLPKLFEDMKEYLSTTEKSR